MAKRLSKLDPKKTLFLLCDIQDKFRPGMALFDNMIINAKKLVNAGKVLEVPLIATEHYPEKLGKTAQELDVGHAAGIISKTKFSMMVPQLEAKIKELFPNEKPKDVVLFGLESHVCIEQTAIDLIENDYKVNLVADCCCSRLNQDRDLALDRLKELGCIITTSESVIFNLMQDKNHPKFNIVRKFIAEPSADMQLSRAGSAKL
ncbi:isochorismatase domain-containing protein 1 [Episyrphus balteatus]|uniref:isochorismatase domain-containing protein 1 n=1 Tax=Episyrphus balteatus TaxID=286459 RepID=UPI002485BC34|nr:isochorismatase domain-containing protein 1 [Episyrphus balteatus]XP_055853375.1 isochorismatase domain-containing protein 1 [Episyrphus balteatus]